MAKEAEEKARRDEEAFVRELLPDSEVRIHLKFPSGLQAD